MIMQSTINNNSDVKMYYFNVKYVFNNPENTVDYPKDGEVIEAMHLETGVSAHDAESKLTKFINNSGHKIIELDLWKVKDQGDL